MRERERKRESVSAVAVHDTGKPEQGIFGAVLEHKRVIVLAQMLLLHNKQDTMFLLS